jgi:hypothetical protein
MDQSQVWNLLNDQMMKSYDLLYQTETPTSSQETVIIPQPIDMNPNLHFFGDLNVTVNDDYGDTDLSDSEVRDKVIQSN